MAIHRRDGSFLTATPAQHFGIDRHGPRLWACGSSRIRPARLLQRRQRLLTASKAIGDAYGPFDTMETGAYDKRWAFVHM